MSFIEDTGHNFFLFITFKQSDSVFKFEIQGQRSEGHLHTRSLNNLCIILRFFGGEGADIFLLASCTEIKSRP